MKYYKDSFKRRESAAKSFLGKLAAVWSTPSRSMPVVLSHCQTQNSGALLPAQAGSSAPAQASTLRAWDPTGAEWNIVSNGAS